MNSNRKGKEGERELANLLKSHGYDCRRGQQFCGSNGDADVVGLPGIHIECKRVEKRKRSASGFQLGKFCSCVFDLILKFFYVILHLLVR